MARPLLIGRQDPTGATNMKTILKNTILGVTLIASSLAIADTTKTTTAQKTASKATPNPLAGTNKPRTTSAAAAKLEAMHLDTFDDLDYNVFSGQDWANLHRSHHKDVTVHWPDGRETKGIDKHIDDLKAMFVYAPDTRIKQHPVKIAKGEWTAVVGVMEGTFTKPMPIGDGKFIQPNNRTFKISMATISHWNKDGTMDEEFLFWDNETYKTQLGLIK
jgi:SnoaL-like polyketide cyclase